MTCICDSEYAIEKVKKKKERIPIKTNYNFKNIKYVFYDPEAMKH